MSSSGSSLATVATAFRRAPRATPRMFTSDQKPNVTSSTRGCHGASAGTSCPTLAANTVATAAVANRPSIHSRTPERNAAYGPSAAPTYAYGPPVIETRLPASAMHSTIRPIATAQTT